MATNETSSVPETVGESAPATGVGAIKEENNPDTRPSSPDPSCPICLDNVTDAAYTDMCCHRFCFHCLVSWSRVKPECPLCKQRFSLIIHNVRSMGDYDELPVTWSEPPPPALDANFFISVAFQRPRFRYRTTGGWSWRFHDVLAGPSSHATNTSPVIPNSTLPSPVASPVSTSNPLIVPTPTSAPPFFPPESSNSFMGNTVAMEWRRRRQVSASEFRNNIYRQNQWVCPSQPRNGEPYRVRECSPAFYRNNPAQANRLLPWLHRELLVLLDVWYDCEDVCLRILQAITNIPIRSPRFQAMMWPYLNERTAHFIHEFYHFAISPYDMLAYDLRAEYSRRSTDSEPHLSDDNSDSSDIEVIETPEARPELIEISDDEDGVRVEAGESNSDASVEIIATIPPPALRTPEIIDLVEDSVGSDVERSSTLDSSRACQSVSDMIQSTPVDDHKTGPFSPSITDKRERVGDRLRNKYQPYYKDESSSTEEEAPRRRQVRKRKRKNEPSKKRKRIVENYSSSDSHSELNVQERLQPSNLKSSSLSSNRKPHSPIKFKSPSSAEEKSSESKSSSSTCTTESSARSRCSERRKKSALPGMSHKDKTRLLDVCKGNNFKPMSDFTTEYLSTNSRSPSLPSLSFSPNPFTVKNEKRPLNDEPTGTNNDTVSLDFEWSSPSFSGSNDDTPVNPSTVGSSASRSSSPKPRLKSIVKKIEPNLEAGCSNWPLHNLRQRKVTRYVYPPYFSTSDSDS